MVNQVRFYECAKFRGSRAFMVLVDLVPSLWVRNVLSLTFRGSKIFSCGYFLGQKFYDFQKSSVKNQKKKKKKKNGCGTLTVIFK